MARRIQNVPDPQNPDRTIIRPAQPGANRIPPPAPQPERQESGGGAIVGIVVFVVFILFLWSQKGKETHNEVATSSEAVEQPLSRQFSRYNNYDIDGHDIPQVNARGRVSGSDCQEQCQADLKCVAFVYDKINGMCFPKNFVPPLRFDPTSVAVIANDSKSSVTGLTDPVITEKFARRAYYGEEYSSMTASSATSCVKLCLNEGYDRCAAVTYFSRSGVCKLLTSIESTERVDDATSWVRRQKAPE